MIVFLVSMAVGFATFAVGFVLGVRHGVEQEEGRWRSMDSITYTDPIIDVYIPVMKYPAIYDVQERGDLG